MSSQTQDGKGKQIFISWSRSYSQKLAERLKIWLLEVLAIPTPFLSTSDLLPGTLAKVELSEQLRNTDFIILCYTPENLNSDWMTFEAGAVYSKGIDNSYICPVLFGDIKHDQLPSVINDYTVAHFKDKGSMKKLLYRIDSAYGDLLTQTGINAKFEHAWETFKKDVDEINEQYRKLNEEDQKDKSWFKSTFEHIGLKLDNLHTSIRGCELNKNPRFDDIKKTVALINSGKATQISPTSFTLHAETERERCDEFLAVFPLTYSGIDYFLKYKNTAKKNWYEAEKSLKEKRKNKKITIRRVVIINESELGSPDGEMKAFIKQYKDTGWMAISDGVLKEKEKENLYREFCIIKTGRGDQEKRIAYFTYLDSEHKRIFTKGPWDQYRTENDGYIDLLENDFNTLWRKAKPIKVWVEHYCPD